MASAIACCDRPRSLHSVIKREGRVIDNHSEKGSVVLLNPEKLVSDACEFGLVAHALQHFEIADGRQRERAELIESPRGLRVAAQMPDQHIGIDQHRGTVQDSLREPSRL